MRRILFTGAALALTVLAPAFVRAEDSENKQAAEQIATALRDSGRMQKYSVGVKYKNGTVWLTGRVTSDEQMKAALEVISDIEGVRKIVNSLTVAGASPGTGLKQPLGAMPAGRPTARRASATSADLERTGTTRRQPLGTKTSSVRGAAARRVSATSLDLENGDASATVEEQAAPADADAVPAGFHRLAAGRAARHAPPVPAYMGGPGGAPAPAFDQPSLPNYAWPSYAASPNYAAVTYPKQYSPTAWPFIGPFYPYPQVPLGWRKVALEWDDGWWFLDFYDRSHH